MLTTAFASFSVDELTAASNFYTETLSLNKDKDYGEIGFSIKMQDGSRFMVYGKPDHAPASFTVMNFPVDDVRAAVRELADKGVSFERYDGTNGPKTDEDGVAEDETTKIAWFKDPAGNVLSVIELTKQD